MLNISKKAIRSSIYLFIIFASFLFTGCSKKDQMTNFIPTQVPQQKVSSKEEAKDDIGKEDTTSEEGTEEVPVGPIETKYVKLDEYGGYLNVRSKPSLEGDIVGFLVHAEEVKVIEIVDGWAKINYTDKVCYVNAKYLVDERPDYLTPPPATPTPKPTTTTENSEVKPEI